MKRVLVVGDAMIDLYWRGRVKRLSPEAPVPVVSEIEVEHREGAAACVTRNLHSMLGHEYVDALYSESYHGNPIEKLRLMGEGLPIARIDFDSPQLPIDQGLFEKQASRADIIVFSDYGKGALRFLPEMVWWAKARHKMILIDPKSHQYRSYAGADLLKPNLEEMQALVGRWESESELEHKVKKLQRMGEIGAVLLTRGAEGMTLYNGAVTSIDPFPAQGELVDVCGAGDVALAALAASLARGECIAVAAARANHAAALSVRVRGTATIAADAIFSGGAV